MSADGSVRIEGPVQVLHAVCSVIFDVDVGQRIEAVYPAGSLTEEEAKQLAFHAFPDSMSFELHTRSSIRDSSFFFRMPRSAAPGFLYGHVFCRQRQDERLRRGGEQRAAVVISRYPLSPVLTPLARWAGPHIMAYGSQALRRVFDEVAAWPPLEWGTPTTLPLGAGGATMVQMPDLCPLPLPLLGTDPNLAAADSSELDAATGLPLSLLPRAFGQQEVVHGLFSDVDVFTPFASVLSHIWTLWEMVILGEPLLVVAPTPAACSGAVAALVSLLTPFPPVADFRPYFTIHDPCFPRLAAAAGALAHGGVGDVPETVAPLPFLLGVTNPYFLKALPGWPNVLSTGYSPLTRPPDQALSRSNSADDEGSSAEAVPARPASAGRGGIGGFLRRRPQGAAGLLSSPSDSMWASYRPLSRPDAQLLDSLAAPQSADGSTKRSRLAQLNSALLRRHFQELTRALLFPLMPYISPTLPPPAPPCVEDLRHPPPLPPFDKEAVLQNLGSRAGTVPDLLVQRFGGQKQLVEFYRRFLSSPNLREWLARRQAAAVLWQRHAWRAALWQAGGGAPAEVLAVEQFFGLERRLEAAEAETGSSEVAQLKEGLKAAFGALPSDLKDALLLSPERARVLGE